jgi:Tfp pilus assembly protein PilP
MKLTTALLATSLALGTAWGQSPTIVDQTRQKLAAVEQQQTAASNNAWAATQGRASTAAAPAASKPATATAAAKPVAGNAAPATQTSNTKKPQVTVVPMAAPKETGRQRTAKTKAANLPSTPPAKPAEAKAATAAENKPSVEEPKKDEPKSISMAGRRDPFISPVVSHASGGSGCSSGKRCLAVDQIALTGIVKSDGGMIAIVVNALNKAYFLRENDPVFNGYVVKITGDSIVFKETIQDDLGKPVTREITKKITTPAV